jgi:hypothetical protein
MLVAGGFCYRMLLDESCIARESQNSPDSCACLRPAPHDQESREPGIDGSSRSIRIFRPSEDGTAVGRGRRLGYTARGLKAVATSPSAVGAADKALLSAPAAWATRRPLDAASTGSPPGLPARGIGAAGRSSVRRPGAGGWCQWAVLDWLVLGWRGLHAWQ